MRAITQLLPSLGERSASDVTIEDLPNAAGPNERALDSARSQRSDDLARGQCIAKGRTRGNSIRVSRDEAAALVGAGATDAR